ncbi:hypothetical protein PENTCL1PPCAC_21336, partial [Pristionchus entomophagus]
FSLASALAKEDKREGCTPPRAITCGDERHELTKSDCQRWDYIYCMKTLSRTSPIDGCISSELLVWDRSSPWRLLASAAPILTWPCLNMEESSLTIFCNEDVCNDTLVDKGISICAERYSRGFVQYVERAPVDSPPSCPECRAPENSSSPIVDAHSIALLIILAFLILQIFNTYRHTAKLERMHDDMCLNAVLPPQPSKKSDFIELTTYSPTRPP